MNDATLILVGNPNCGKTTLFNALTGKCQRVGNWPGVTVEQKIGCFATQNQAFTVIDLPGIYSLTPQPAQYALDEKIALESILSHAMQASDPKRPLPLILHIIDATALERQLYLTSQLLELPLPVLVVLTMMDVAKHNELQIDVDRLSKELGRTVIGVDLRVKSDISKLKAAIAQEKRELREPLLITYPPILEQAISDGAEHLKKQQTDANVVDLASNQLQTDDILRRWLAARALEGEIAQQAAPNAHQNAYTPLLEHLAEWKQTIAKNIHVDSDIAMADARFKWLQTVLPHVQKRESANKPMHASSQALDRLFLNRFLGLPIFLGIMYALFFFTINIGGAFQDAFNGISNAIFIDGFAKVLHAMHVPDSLIVLLAHGIGKGINTTLTFIPVIGALFLFLSFLEDSGYMARAAFLVDRVLNSIGLPGKAFVPMIVGFGCNVPAIMSARTLASPSDRLITIFMAPFMSCSARLAIFAVFAATFFGSNGHNVIFALYLIGIAMALFTGFLLRRTLLTKDPAPLVMELPPYHMPRLKNLWRHTTHRLHQFIWRAARIIIPVCMLIGVANSLSMDGSFQSQDAPQKPSVLKVVGQQITPLFAPIGIREDNWPATVGLLTGVLAKEVVIGSLNTIYSQREQLQAGSKLFDADISTMAAIYAALATIPRNFAALPEALSNPILAKAPVETLATGVDQTLLKHFDGARGAFAYLLFVLLYVPCIATIAAIAREAGTAWATFSMIWMTGIAYGAATAFYQASTFAAHRASSSAWLLAIIGTFIGTLLTMRAVGKRANQPTHPSSRPVSFAKKPLEDAP